MIPKELFRKVRRIQITSSRLVNDVFAGQYHSVFKGRGMEFDEVREYQLGDEIRTIDWNVTARTGKVHVKKYVEERELTVMILIDASRSCQFASRTELKSRLAAEIAAVLGFSAIKNKDKVGLIIFTDRIELYLPPRKGVKHVLKVIREVLYFQPQGLRTDIPAALEFLSLVLTRSSVAFLFSDFMDEDLLSDGTVAKYPDARHRRSPAESSSQDGQNTEVSERPPLQWSSGSVVAPGNEEITPQLGVFRQSRIRKALAIAGKRHDLIAVTLNDPLESQLPDCGILELEDAELGSRTLIDTGDPAVRDQYARQAGCRIEQRDRLFRGLGLDQIDISTDVPYPKELVKFFLKRRRRYR